MASRHSTVVPCPEQPTHPNFASLPLLSRPEIALRIAGGEILVIHLPLVYRVPTAWLDLHPGRDKAILHYVGRDASNEIEAYHAGKTIHQRMRRWVVGKVETDDDGWRDMVPPIQLSMWPPPVPVILISPATPNKSDIENAENESNEKKAEDEAPLRLLTPALVDPPLVDIDKLPLTPYVPSSPAENWKLALNVSRADAISSGPTNTICDRVIVDFRRTSSPSALTPLRARSRATKA